MVVIVAIELLIGMKKTHEVALLGIHHALGILYQ